MEVWSRQNSFITSAVKYGIQSLEMMETEGERQRWQKEQEIRGEGRAEKERGIDYRFPKEEKMKYY